MIERINNVYTWLTRISPEKRVLAWIRKRIHPYCWGTSDRFKQGFTQTSSRQILDFFGCLRFGLPKRFLPTPRNGDFMAHVTGQLILYFQSNGRRRVPETLVKIDIDCHSKGSFQGAVECVEWLRGNGFPRLVLVSIDQWSWYPRLPCRP